MAKNCATLAENARDIITQYNINALSLSNYDTSLGTQVTVRCLSNKSHELIGPNVLRCLPSGQWNDSIPTCEVIKPNPVLSGTVAPGPTTIGPQGAVQACITDYLNLPYLIGLIFLILLCTVLIILLCYSNRVWKKKRRRSSFIYSFQEGTGSSSPSQQTDIWVEMASPPHFRSHELALTAHDHNLIKDIRYTQIHPSWSGY